MPSATAAQREAARRLQRGLRLGTLVDPQRLYGHHLRTLQPGFVLDIGCGVGRTLAHVRGNGIGIDINPACVEIARQRGFQAVTPEEFDGAIALLASQPFDSLLFAHVLEHMTSEAAEQLVTHYLALLRTGGQVIVIVPQARGHRHDATHVRRVHPADLAALGQACGLRLVRCRSFPLPSWMGRLFTYNETVAVFTRVATAGSDSDRGSPGSPHQLPDS